MEHRAIIEVKHDVLVEMNRILALDEGLEDTKNGDLIQCFTAQFDNGFFADVVVCNGSVTDEFAGAGDPPWIDCILFDDGNEVACFVGEGDSLDGEYIFHDGDDKYVVTVKEKNNGG